MSEMSRGTSTLNCFCGKKEALSGGWADSSTDFLVVSITITGCTVLLHASFNLWELLHSLPSISTSLLGVF